MINREPTAEDISAAHNRIYPYIHETPLDSSRAIDRMLGCQLILKCENLQKVGAFKMRGATNVILQLDEKNKRNGVATHSSGNHAQAVAMAAKMRQIPAYIVMPRTAPKVKKAAVLEYGAHIIECEPTLEARESKLKEVVEQTGAFFVHPFDNYDIIAGQATAAKELNEAEPELDAIFTPVGGGGLLSGTLLTVYNWAPGTKVYAGEPEGADDAYQSLLKGELVPSINPKTIADGLLTSLSDKTFGIICKYVTDIYCVSDEEIVQAMRLIWERTKLIIEPSSAVPIAALIKHKAQFQGQRVGVIISGGNVDLGKLPF